MARQHTSWARPCDINENKVPKEKEQRGLVVRLINIAKHVQIAPKVVMMNVIWIQYLNPSTATSPFLADMDVSWDMPPLTPFPKPKNV